MLSILVQKNQIMAECLYHHILSTHWMNYLLKRISSIPWHQPLRWHVSGCFQPGVEAILCQHLDHQDHGWLEFASSSHCHQKWRTRTCYPWPIDVERRARTYYHCPLLYNTNVGKSQQVVWNGNVWKMNCQIYSLKKEQSFC